MGSGERHEGTVAVDVRELGAAEPSEEGSDQHRNRRRIVAHPLLFAAFPVLYLFADNLPNGLPLGQLARPLAFVVGLTAILFAVLSLLLRNARKAGLAVSALVVLFFSYGYASRLARGWSVGGVDVGSDGFLTVMWEILAVASVAWVVGTRRRLADSTLILNVVSAGLVAMNLLTIGFLQLQAGPGGNYLSVGDVVLHSSASAAGEDPPDIYYVMLEDYAGASALRGQFGFDNEPFLDELAARGLYVARESTANYPITLLSLASSLNMQYLDPITRVVGSSTRNPKPAIASVQDSEVVRLLKGSGYNYVHIGSWWVPTTSNPDADENVRFGGFSEFSTALYQTTALWPIASRFRLFPNTLDVRTREWNRLQFQFDQIARTREAPGPTFVFAHIMAPHAPYVFDRNGRLVTPQVAKGRSEEENYLEQLQFVNQKVLDLVDELLSGPEDSRPIIIVQSDEGPYPGDPKSWEGLPPETLARKFPILNAYFLPGVDEPGLYPTITPVNSFRVVLDRYFEADLPLLPDQNFVFQDVSHLYKFTDVTDQVRIDAGT